MCSSSTTWGGATLAAASSIEADVRALDGDKNMDGWYREVSKYMMSRAPDITHVLKRAEKKTDIIDNNTLEAGLDLRSLFVAGLSVSNPRVLSHYVWGVLNTNLKQTLF